MVFLLSGHKPFRKTSNIWTHLIVQHWSTFRCHLQSLQIDLSDLEVAAQERAGWAKISFQIWGKIPFALMVGGGNHLGLLAFVLNPNQINSNCSCLELCLPNKLGDNFFGITYFGAKNGIRDTRSIANKTDCLLVYMSTSDLLVV